VLSLLFATLLCSALLNHFVFLVMLPGDSPHPAAMNGDLYGLVR
jgi:hypothetical protein